jgi:radical SAM superfamily enzyme YgiQ (UPF0313 family)
MNNNVIHPVEAGVPRSDSHDNESLANYCAKLRSEYPIEERNGRILFVQIPQGVLGAFNKDAALGRGYYAFPPTGLQYLYEAIKHRGMEVKILDLNFELLKRVFENPNFNPLDWPEMLEEAIDEYKPAIVGVSCLFDLGIQPLFEVLRRVRKRKDIIAIAGGVIATYEWKSLITDDLGHFAIRGEGENRLNFLLSHLLPETGDTKPTPSIFYNDGSGYIESKGPADIVVIHGNLVDSYDLIKIEEYANYGSLNPFSRRAQNPPTIFAPIQFSRGCRAACTFCAVSDFMGKGVRHRVIEDVIEEIEHLYHKHGVRHLEWLDDDLLFHRQGVKDLLRRIIEKKIDIHWSSNNGLVASSIDEEMFALMRDSGCIGFKIGIETGNEAMLRKVRKPATHKKFLEFSKMLDRYQEIFVGGNFIIGLPEETFAQMMDTFRFALEMKLDWAATTVCQALRGAAAFSEAGELFESQIKTEGATVKNFIPVRASLTGRIAMGSLLRNLEVFRTDPTLVPPEDHVKEIWFAFNIIINYVNNKNLKPGGRPQKFVNWVRNAQQAYPTNPYMAVFIGLAFRLLGQDADAENCHQLAVKFANDDYWRDRFSAFFLDSLLSDFPNDAAEVYDRLALIWENQKVACADWLALPRGEFPAITVLE